MMSNSQDSVVVKSLVPEDGLDDVEFEQYLDDENHMQRRHTAPTMLAKRIHSMVSEALSMCQSVVGKSSAIDYIETACSLLGQSRTDYNSIVVDQDSLPEDGLDDAEFEQYQGDRSWALSACSVFVNTSTVDYVETARSFLDKVNSDYNEFRNIVTGGAADGWYTAPLPVQSPVLSPVPSPTYCVGPMLCFAPLVPPPAPVTTCGASNHMNMPSSACTATATQVGNTAAPASCDSPSLHRTPLRSEAAVFQPVKQEQAEEPVKPGNKKQKEEPLTHGGQEQKEHTPTDAAPQTTLMLRNIPTSLGRSDVMDMLQSEGFGNRVTFIYLPMNLRRSCNFGYAFVDFESSEDAEQCIEKLEGFTAWSEPAENGLEAAWSETQGLDAHVQRYRDSPLMHESLEDEFKPAVFKNGVRIAFAPPTKPLRAPRLRR